MNESHEAELARTAADLRLVHVRLNNLISQLERTRGRRGRRRA